MLLILSSRISISWRFSIYPTPIRPVNRSSIVSWYNDGQVEHESPYVHGPSPRLTKSKWTREIRLSHSNERPLSAARELQRNVKWKESVIPRKAEKTEKRSFPLLPLFSFLANRKLDLRSDTAYGEKRRAATGALQSRDCRGSAFRYVWMFVRASLIRKPWLPGNCRATSATLACVSRHLTSLPANSIESVILMCRVRAQGRVTTHQ